MSKSAAELGRDGLLSYETQRALGSYALTARRAREATEVLALADEIIRYVNQGLPTGHMVGTRSSYTPDELNMNPGIGGFNRFYKVVEGKLAEWGSVCTEGASYPFLGNRIENDGDDLVIVNDELGIGLQAKAEVFITDTAADSSENTIGGSDKHRFETSLLPLLQSVEFGQQIAFDCSYY
jgi:hypothetical protein